MRLETLREYCKNKVGSREDMPFGPGTLVMKAGGKIYLLTGENDPVISINLKCDPFLAQDLREHYKAVKPGYHMNKIHWNTVELDGSIPDDELFKMIDHSYELIIKGLTKIFRKGLGL